ncbi:MAG TPA: DUF4349 domain-containing protein [Acidimicrobiales bacterium]|nr:DUF4349 domain-containing protein [Acidimicrobiales bacterium]
MTTARARWLAAGLLVVAGVAAGCSGSGDSDGSASHGAAVESAAPTVAGADSAGGSRAAAPPAAAGKLALAPDPGAVRAAARDVVRTGTITLRVDDVEHTTDRLRDLATDGGGFVSDEDADAEDHEADVTLRVPAERFDRVRAGVADLGKVTSQKVEARDVTAEVVDVDSRTRSLRASVARVRGLLAGTGDVVQLATVEGELARREAELESLEAQQRVLEDQVTLATLHVHVTRTTAPTPAEGIPGFGKALHTGWVTMVDVAKVISAAAGFALPFAIPAALAFLAYRAWRRSVASVDGSG